MTARIDPALRRTLDTFLDRIKGEYPVAEAWLYGSRARGDHRADSDIDVAVILEGPRGSASAISADMAGTAADVLLETELFVSPLAVWKEDWANPARHSNPWLLHNIKREGIAV